MLAYIIRRILQLIPVLFLISLLVFLMLHFIPGDPAVVVAGLEAPVEVVEQIRAELGLDKPLRVQYLAFMGRILKGDLGTSIRTGAPVTLEIAERFPYTLTIAFWATLLAAVVGMTTGVIAAVNHNRFWDNVTMVLTLLAISTPSYWLGLMLMLLFALYLGLLPSFGVSTPLHYIMPVITLGTQSAGLIARMTRSAMLDVLSQDYVRTARAKGLREIRVILKHGLKNALLPVVTIVGLRFGGLLAGTVLVESVFAIPGIGRMMVDGVLNRDYPMVQGAVLIIAASFVIINMLVDVLYALIDPRIHYS
jgi:ABC-type dipeptide/oligopeptide/nickel transport system permease component